MATIPLTIEERLARLEGVYDHLASKADLAELRAILKDDIARIESEFKDDIARVESNVKGDIARVESEFKNDIARLQAEIAELKGSIKVLLVVMTSGLALLNIVLRFWPT